MSICQPLLIPILHKNEEKYQLVEEWWFEHEACEEPVPLGLVVDGASVPRSAWCFMPPDGLHRAGSLAHDWLYIMQGVMPQRTLTRQECDLIFYRMMVDAGVAKRRAGLTYRAVRAAGRRAWNSVEAPTILPIPIRKARLVALSIGAPELRTPDSHIYAAP